MNILKDTGSTIENKYIPRMGCEMTDKAKQYLFGKTPTPYHGLYVARTGWIKAVDCLLQEGDIMEQIIRPLYWNDGQHIHACDSGEMHNMRFVWTKCKKDVPSNKAYYIKDGSDKIDCNECLGAI